MRYNLIDFLKKTTVAFAIISFSSSLVYAQTISLLDDNLPEEETAFSSENNIDDSFSLFDEEIDNSFIQPSSANVEKKTSFFDEDELDIDDEQVMSSFDNLEFNREDLDEINKTIGEEPKKITPEPIRKIPSSSNDYRFGENIIEEIEEDLFSQMSDLEKQTALLTLELKRERIKTEIEAIRIQRAQALQAEENAKELKERERKEWEIKQQQVLIAEQENLAKTKIVEEQLRQEKIVKSYKEKMLLETKDWMDSLDLAYKKVKSIEEERDNNLQSFKNKLHDLSVRAEDLARLVDTLKINHGREVTNCQAQVTALSTRVDTLNADQAEGIDNPFSRPGFGTTEDPNIKLSDEYMIIEISGRGGNLVATLANKSGEQAFKVQKGTALKSGHVIESIEPTYIKADRGGSKDFIYFVAGGILDKEPETNLKLRNIATPTQQKDENTGNSTIPSSFLDGMFAN